MTSRLFKILSILAVATLIAGCKLDLMVSSGGWVTSLSGTRNCPMGSLCEFNITDSTFNETFTAVARPGYVFSKWSAGDGFLCANSVNPVCAITNVGTAGIPIIEGVIAGGSIFYAMPVFTFVGLDTDGDGTKDNLDADDDNDGILDVSDTCPVDATNTCILSTDTVTVNGRVWAQPDIFSGLGVSTINAVCPGGVCVNGGVLNGYNMTGMKWASISEVYALLRPYFPSNVQCSTNNPPYILCDGPKVSFASFVADGWRSWGPNAPSVYGWTSDHCNLQSNFCDAAWIIGYESYSVMSTEGPGLGSQLDAGGWFYRFER